MLVIWTDTTKTSPSASKRGFTYSEAMQYVGVKRRTFDEEWRPHLKHMRQGACLIFDVQDLDALFDKFKAASPGKDNNQQDDDRAQNAPRNGRPEGTKGVSKWAEKQPVSTPAKKEPGKLTSGGKALDFASVASAVLKKRKAG